jgi:hypothetical protein
MKKYLATILMLLSLNVSHEVYASCESCTNGADKTACPASCSNTSQTLKLNETTTKPAPLPKLNDADIISLSAELNDNLTEKTESKKVEISEEEYRKRFVEAKKMFNSPKVNEFLVALKANKQNLVNMLKNNDCLDPNFENAASNFMDKLITRKVNEDQLAAGFSSLFTDAEIKRLSTNINNPPQEFQSRIGLIVTQFVLNEAPELFTQFMKFAGNQECIRRLQQQK